MKGLDMRSNNWSLWLVVGMFLAVLAFLAVVMRPARGQDFDAKVAQLKAKTAAKKADPFAGKNKASGFTTPYLKGECGEICGCGCIQTGSCTCPNCNSPVSTKPVPQPVAANNHGVPGMGVPEIPGNPWRWDDAWAAQNNGNGWWRYGNGTSPGTSPVAQPTYYEPVQQYYQPVRSFRSFGGFSGGGCSNGSCR